MKLNDLKGIGPKTIEKLNTYGIHRIEDILFHLPFRYQDRTRVIAIDDLRPGDNAIVEVEVVSSKIKFGRKRQLEVMVQDASGSLLLKFFHFNSKQQQSFVEGTMLRCFGEVKLFKRTLMMIHPEYQRVQAGKTQVAETLTPVYPTTDGLHQASWIALSDQALQHMPDQVPELLPEGLRTKYNLSDIESALSYVHRPPPDVEQTLLEQGMHPMQQRLAFEELLAHQISLHELRKKIRKQKAHACAPNNKNNKTQHFLKQLPFTLTQAQDVVWHDICNDLAQASPMMRLIQGDVGSGKTVVAALAALQVIENGFQVAIMAPTELLAEQHYNLFCQWFTALDINVAWLAGKLKAAKRREMLDLIKTGKAQCVIGTHALFQKSVEFNNLALVIVDEQHRFGVAQRQALRVKGVNENIYPHQLIMTATPIPRTLAMTVYADLDTSIIDQLPPGRSPIQTVVVNNQRRDEVTERVEQLCQQGGQVYWVCPLIEESESLQCEAAEITADKLATAMPEIRIGLVHGRMKAEQKQLVMQQFQQHKLDVLVATTVIEVGINVPNATLMIVENPERMGLAQLHQLRGRVGRGAKQSHCVLLYQDPLSETARRRLQVMRDSTDGFYIAEQDLKLRGPGELVGTKQTGLQRLRIANIFRDRKLLPKVQQAARELLACDKNESVAIKQRWLGAKEKYSQV